MMKNKKSFLRLETIRKENARFEKESPYNFCDRWCERCPQKKRDRCKVYQDDLNRNLQHISNGKDPYDMTVALEDVKENFEKTKELIQKWAKEENVDLTQIDDSNYEEQRRKERQLLEHPLYKLAVRYSKEANAFLKETFYDSQMVEPELIDDYETVSWYHTLLPTKVNRFLCDIYARDDEDDFGLYDAVAQIEISRKSLLQSEKALKNILKENIIHRHKISELLDILQEIARQINTIEAETFFKMK